MLSTLEINFQGGQSYIGSEVNYDSEEDRIKGEREMIQTIIHEMSHRHCNPRTDDIKWSEAPNSDEDGANEIYGEESCLKLAKLLTGEVDWKLGLKNADSFGYFCVSLGKPD